MAFPECHMDPTACNEVYARATLGAIYQYGGKLYRYVQILNAVAVADGTPLMPVAVDNSTVTADVTGGASGNALDSGLCSGVAVRAMTQNYYGYILVRGYKSNLQTDGNVAGVGPLILDGTDAVCKAWSPTSTAATVAQLKQGLKAFAFAQGADSSTDVAAFINCPI